MKSVFVYAEVSEDLPATSQLLRVSMRNIQYT